MSTEKKDNYSNIAKLFEKIELKNFLSNYLYFIIGIELLIFLISFLGNIGPDKGEFPWKFYFYVSFITPITITFLLGIFIVAFNHFIFNKLSKDKNGRRIDNYESESKVFKVNSFLSNMREAPFLPILFVIIVGTMFLYKLDVILLFLFDAGEKVIKYIFLIFLIILSMALVLGAAWVLTNYHLSRKQMEHEHKYRNDVLNKLGILIMNNNIIVSKDGKILQGNTIELETEKKNKLKILPPSN